MLNEGYLLSNKTISVDLKNIKNEKILIVGIAGSGKTTLGKKLANQFKIPYRTTDICPFNWNKIKLNPDLKEKLLVDYIDCVGKMILDNKKGILEGVGLIEVYTKRPKLRRAILKLPVIILGISVLKSGLRSQKRSKKNTFDLFFFKQNFKFYQQMFNKFRKDRIAVPGAKVEEYYLEKINNETVEWYLKKIQCKL